MIGYYIHHQGHGHLHRAAALAAALDEAVVGLSSLPRPDRWCDGWVLLDRDDQDDCPEDPTAGGRLHWAPRRDEGLRRRMAQLSTWFDEAGPRLVVVDVSVEVAMLARLHGLPVATVVLPGRRTDAAHRLGQDVSEHLVGFWPPEATARLLPDLPADLHGRVHALGGLSRFPVAEPRPRRTGPPRVVVLSGTGGPAFDVDRIDRPPGWEWLMLGPATPSEGATWRGGWEDDPRALIADADVVVTHAGQNAVAEVAAMRRPAVIVPQPRPHDEQRVTAGFLRSGRWPALVEDRLPHDGWAPRLARALSLDGSRWAGWVDGRAAQRFAEVLAP